DRRAQRRPHASVRLCRIVRAIRRLERRDIDLAQGRHAHGRGEGARPRRGLRLRRAARRSAKRGRGRRVGAIALLRRAGAPLVRRHLARRRVGRGRARAPALPRARRPARVVLAGYLNCAAPWIVALAWTGVSVSSSCSPETAVTRTWMLPVPIPLGSTK